jgi:hypothetical protein
MTLLTEREAAAWVRVFDHTKNPVRQFREWACRAGVPVKRVGRRRLYDPKVLAAFVDGESWAVRHRETKLRRVS